MSGRSFRENLPWAIMLFLTAFGFFYLIWGTVREAEMATLSFCVLVAFTGPGVHSCIALVPVGFYGIGKLLYGMCVNA